MGLITVTVSFAQRQSQSRCAVFCHSVSSVSVDLFTVVQGLITDHNKIIKTPDTGLRLLSFKPHSPRNDLLSWMTPGWQVLMAAKHVDCEYLNYISKCKGWFHFQYDTLMLSVRCQGVCKPLVDPVDEPLLFPPKQMSTLRVTLVSNRIPRLISTD